MRQSLATGAGSRDISVTALLGWSGPMNRTILIADDKPQMRRILRSLLESHPGWDVTEAEDGLQAVERAQQCKPDVVVLDLAMPELNGFEAARRIANTFPEVPIFLNTLYASPQVEKEAEKLGVQRVISKTEEYQLVQAIEEVFGASGIELTGSERPRQQRSHCTPRQHAA